MKSTEKPTADTKVQDAKKTQAEPYGSVLGVIDSDPSKKLPRAAKDTGGNPRGIDVRPRLTGTDELPQRSGFTSADMGGAGEGTEVPEDTAVERPEQD
ncbi:MAG TPA: hypothetical protein VND92_06200 [Vicinamibacterales bacterium]|nr:hypothetical protein [Vicinamibacterales bacterium]